MYIDSSKRNRSITLVIRDYTNKRSGRVMESRKDIKRRFDCLDWKDQKKIVLEFLKSGKEDRDWIYRKLRYLWDESFEEPILENWDQMREERCAWVIIRHCKLECIDIYLDDQTKDKNYYFICRRFLENNHDFVIDPRRFNDVMDYLNIMDMARKDIPEADLRDAVKTLIRSIYAEPAYIANAHRTHRHLLFNPKRGECLSLNNYLDIYNAKGIAYRMGHQAVAELIDQWDDDIIQRITGTDEFHSLTFRHLEDWEYLCENRKLTHMVLKEMFPVEEDLPLSKFQTEDYEISKIIEVLYKCCKSYDKSRLCIREIAGIIDNYYNEILDCTREFYDSDEVIDQITRITGISDEAAGVLYALCLTELLEGLDQLRCMRVYDDLELHKDSDWMEFFATL